MQKWILMAVGCALAAPMSVWGQGQVAALAPAKITVQDSANEISLAVGKSVLVDCARPIKRVAVGIGEIAIASAISPNEIMVNGKAAGETSLILWDTAGGRQFFNVTVRAAQSATDTKLESVRREILDELPGQGVKVTGDVNAVYLRGLVNNLTSSTRAVQIASTSGLKVVNLLNVKVPDAEPQILLKVRFASYDRSKAEKMGINLFSLGLGNTVGGISSGALSPPTISGGSSTGSSSGSGVTSSSGSATFSSDYNFLAYFPGLNAGAEIEALETKGGVQILAEPNLVTTSGKQASFLAGGEYPYPTVQGSGSSGNSVTIQFKEYGVRLNFLPTITPRGTIHLQVAPEVSSLNTTDEVTISGFTIPSITTRKVRTEVELKAGDSFIIGGLLDRRETQTLEKIPFIGDIPVLGKFFQSKTKSRTNSELIVIVTPEYVDPIPAGQTLPELNYPQKFLPRATDGPMHHPDDRQATTAPKTAPREMPVEKLVESLKPGPQLVIDNDRGTFGTGGSTGGQSSTSTSVGVPSN